MAKYYVRVKAACIDEFEIEANDIEEAEDKAFDKMGAEVGFDFDFEVEESYYIDREEEENE